MFFPLLPAMNSSLATTLALGPFGTRELVVIGVVLAFMATMAGGVLILVAYANKKK